MINVVIIRRTDFNKFDILCIFADTVSSNLFAFDRAVEEEKLQKLRKELGNRVKNVDLMLCDEYVHMKSQIILSSLREDQHCVLFTSIKDFKGSASQYVPLHIRQVPGSALHSLQPKFVCLAFLATFHLNVGSNAIYLTLPTVKSDRKVFFVHRSFLLKFLE